MKTNNTIVLTKVNTNVVCLDNTFVLESFAMKLTYGDRLRLAREHKKLSQDKLAELSGVKQGTISKIERGDQHSSGFDAELSYALDVEAMWLKTGKDNFAPSWLLTGHPDTVPRLESNVEPGPEARPPVIDDEAWKALPPKARALVEDFLTKTSSGKLSESGIKLLQNTIDELSKE